MHYSWKEEEKKNSTREGQEGLGEGPVAYSLHAAAAV